LVVAAIVAALTASFIWNRPLPLREWIAPTPTVAPTATPAPVPAATPSPTVRAEVTPTAAPAKPLVFEDVDFSAVSRYSSALELRDAISAARAEFAPQMAVRLAPALGLEDFIAVLRLFDGSFNYTYGTLPPDGELCALIDLSYTPGARIARAYASGQTEGLSDKEKIVYAQAAAIISDPAFVAANIYYKERIIHDALSDRCTYWHIENARDEELEYQTAVGLFLNGRGNCMSYADSFTMLTRMAGFETHTVFGEAMDAEGRWESHAWNIIKLGGVWYAVDVTYDDLDSPPFTSSYIYMNIDKSTLSYTHRWPDGALFEPLAEVLDGAYAYNGCYPDLLRAQNPQEFQDILSGGILSDPNASSGAIGIFCDGFTISAAQVNEWMTRLRLPRAWMSIEQRVGEHQYWTFQVNE
jgi:transglutaminase-like putative cysteine protease